MPVTVIEKIMIARLSSVLSGFSLCTFTCAKPAFPMHERYCALVNAPPTQPAIKPGDVLISSGSSSSETTSEMQNLTPRFKYPENLTECLLLVGNQIQHAIAKDYICIVVTKRNTFNVAFYKINI